MTAGACASALVVTTLLRQPEVVCGHSGASEQLVPASGQRRTSMEALERRYTTTGRGFTTKQGGFVFVLRAFFFELFCLVFAFVELLCVV